MNVRTHNVLSSAHIVRLATGLVALTVMIVSGAPAAWAVILAGNTTVNSIGHSFQPPRVDPVLGPLPGVVTDFLISQSQNVGGGATLPGVSLNLETDTTLSYRIQASAGKHFQVSIPGNALGAAFNSKLLWTVNPGPLGSGGGFPVSQFFENGGGTPPTLTAGGVGAGLVADPNDWFQFSPSSSNVHSFGFSAVTYQFGYQPLALGIGVLSFQPAADSNLYFSYTTNALTDPGRFVTIVPEPSSLVLLGAAGLGLFACIRRRRHV